ncbi:MAG: hypothetical protein Q8L01_03890 [Candidatus Woesebacteria bacterium]|nr:hypothetical protein [Candidatus Woesebacteria bacterium]
MELKSNKFTSVRYHDLFDYKLNKEELVKWQYKNEKIKISKAWPTSLAKDRLQREKYSKNKIKIAKGAVKLISKIPTVKFVGITGALAMNNANKDGDIDLMIITKSGFLWTTRLFAYLLICLFGIQTRKPRVKNERDALCLNMWLDEEDMIWDKSDRNLYTAHEIAQIYPLINKNQTYEKFLYKNKWILDFWPNATVVQKSESPSTKHCVLCTILEPIAFWSQYLYMKNKITREVVTPTRAIFHPNDWGKIVLSKLTS